MGSKFVKRIMLTYWIADEPTSTQEDLRRSWDIKFLSWLNNNNIKLMVDPKPIIDREIYKKYEYEHLLEYDRTKFYEMYINVSNIQATDFYLRFTKLSIWDKRYRAQVKKIEGL